MINYGNYQNIESSCSLDKSKIKSRKFRDFLFNKSSLNLKDKLQSQPLYKKHNMKKILKLLSIVIILFSFTINVDAQTKHNKKDREEMMKTLNLTKEQKTLLKSFHKSKKQEGESIKNNAGLSKEQKKEKTEQLHKERHEKLESILTPEQKEKMKQMKENKPRRGVTNMPNERTAK